MGKITIPSKSEALAPIHEIPWGTRKLLIERFPGVTKHQIDSVIRGKIPDKWGLLDVVYQCIKDDKEMREADILKRQLIKDLMS